MEETQIELLQASQLNSRRICEAYAYMATCKIHGLEPTESGILSAMRVNLNASNRQAHKAKAHCLIEHARANNYDYADLLAQVAIWRDRADTTLRKIQRQKSSSWFVWLPNKDGEEAYITSIEYGICYWHPGLPPLPMTRADALSLAIATGANAIPAMEAAQ